jgi:XFP N-terminal domain
MSTVDQARLRLMDTYWSAANYLTIGQIYLPENALLREPLRPCAGYLWHPAARCGIARASSSCGKTSPEKFLLHLRSPLRPSP